MEQQRELIPPKIPQELKELERAITLLGSRTKTELKGRSRQELESLVGRYPDVKTAAEWKRFLRKTREKRLEENSSQKGN